MAATLGMLVQENYRFDGYLSPSEGLEFSDVPNGLGALGVVPLSGWVQVAVVIGAHELIVKQRDGKAPGDFGTGYFGVALDDQSAKQLRLLNVEVQNGRLAMLGILGMVRKIAPTFRFIGLVFELSQYLRSLLSSLHRRPFIRCLCGKPTCSGRSRLDGALCIKCTFLVWDTSR
jgi:Chlorophyll A-B binding protein